MIREIVVALTLVASTAHADDLRTIALPRTKVVLRLGPSWRALPTERAVDLVAGFTTDAGALLAVTRAQVPNPEAWRAATRTAYLEAIEHGLARSIPKYRRLTRTIGEVHDVPVLDVTATRDGGKTVVIRVLAFRTYALVLACEIDAKALPEIRAIVAAFAPPAAS